MGRCWTSSHDKVDRCTIYPGVRNCRIMMILRWSNVIQSAPHPWYYQNHYRHYYHCHQWHYHLHHHSLPSDLSWSEWPVTMVNMDNPWSEKKFIFFLEYGRNLIIDQDHLCWLLTYNSSKSMSTNTILWIVFGYRFLASNHKIWWYFHKILFTTGQVEDEARKRMTLVHCEDDIKLT